MRVWIVGLALAFLVAPGVLAQPASKEDSLKAVLVFNFTRFVEWPDSAFETTNSPIVIGVMHDEPVAETLVQATRGELVGGRKIVVKRYEPADSIGRCHVLFLGGHDPAQAKAVLQRARGSSVLTVSDMESFLAYSGMVELFTNRDGKIRLRIDLDRARAEGLRISAQLLRVAEVHSKGAS
jgi:hypothetical protein